MDEQISQLIYIVTQKDSNAIMVSVRRLCSSLHVYLVFIKV